MKTHQTLVTGLVTALLKDIAITFPSLSRMCTTFNVAFDRLLQQQGLPLVTIVLPSCGKWFDACLAARHILPNAPLFHGKRSGTPYPKFLYGLWELVFNEEGVLRDSPDHTAVAFLREMYYFAKKLDLECEKERTYEATSSFEKLEASMVRPWPDTWDSDNPSWCPLDGHPIWGAREVDRHQLVLLPELGSCTNSSIPWHHFRSLVRRVVSGFGDLNVWDLVPKHGPGAVSDRIAGLIKYDLAIWPKKLNYVFPSDWFASHDLCDRTVSDEEPSSRMHAVPKTQKGPRLIAAEPTAHQWVQGALRTWLEDAVAASSLSISIDFRDQSYSGALALSSSKDGTMATIDLSEASDRISTRLVQYVFQSHEGLLDALHACRTRAMYIPGDLRQDGKGHTVLLRKFSSMGSAVTFPIQSIIFTLIAHFAIMIVDEDWDVSPKGMRRRSPHIRVFGDDIIIRSECALVMADLLAELGLKVNKEKTFYSGPFREACGMDAFDGVDVTPAYIRTPYSPNKPESLWSVVEASNNFHMKGFWNAADYVLRTVPDEIRKDIIRGHEALWSLTIRSFCVGTDVEGIRTRYDKRLHRQVALTFQLASREVKHRGKGEASLLQYFIEDPTNQLLSSWQAGQAKRPTLKKQRRWVPTER